MYVGTVRLVQPCIFEEAQAAHYLVATKSILPYWSQLSMSSFWVMSPLRWYNIDVSLAHDLRGWESSGGLQGAVRWYCVMNPSP